MEPTHRNLNFGRFVLFVSFCLFFSTIRADCPIENYPTQTIIGFINAAINKDSQKQNEEQTYTFTMKQALSTATPHVLIGVNAIQFEMKHQLRYRAMYQPTPSFGTLNFKLMVQDENNLWQRLQFNFIATNNPHMIANSIQFNYFPSNSNKTRHSLVSTIRIADNMKVKPIIQSYITGISLRAKMSRQNLENSLKQIQSLKRFSWNLNLIRVLNQMIDAQSTISYEIVSNSLSNNTLSIELGFSESAIIESVSISYVIFNSIQFPLKNNLIHYSFSLGGPTASFGFAPLQNTDLTFIGLRGAQHKLNNPLRIDFTAAKSKGSFDTYPTQALQEGFLAYVNFLQMEMKYQFQCQNCPQSVFRFQTYCLTACPRGYVNVKNGTNSTCRYCNISQFIVPNKESSQCQCAKQYFFNQQTQQCETCHYSCLTCANNSTCNSCDTVQITTKRIFNQKQKTCSCTQGSFDNKQNQKLICQKCHQSCLTCSGASMYQCSKCRKGRLFDATNRCVCGPNFVDENDICSCKQPNFLVNQSCYSKVAQGSLCIKPNMIQTTIKNQKVCECSKGYQMYNNQCIQCPKTLTLSIKSGKCQCPPTSYLSSNGSCVSCDSMKYYDTKFQKCLCKKQFSQKQDGTCINCPQKSTYINGNCLCVFNYYLKNRTCIKCKKTGDDPNCSRVSSSQL